MSIPYDQTEPPEVGVIPRLRGHTRSEATAGRQSAFDATPVQRLRAYPITIEADEEGRAFVVAQAGENTGPVTWDEALGQIVSLIVPAEGGRRYAMRTPQEWLALEQRRAASVAEAAAQHANTVTVEITLADARNFQAGLSDILCWARGFRAAHADADLQPLGIEELRDLNIILKRAIAHTEKANS